MLLHDTMFTRTRHFRLQHRPYKSRACDGTCNVIHASVQKPRSDGREWPEVASVQAAVQIVQKRMRHADGSFVQFRCDEKGFLSICAFGLPGNSHEDGPSRAVAAALAVVAAMRNVDQVWPFIIISPSAS